MYKWNRLNYTFHISEQQISFTLYKILCFELNKISSYEILKTSRTAFGTVNFDFIFNLFNNIFEYWNLILPKWKLFLHYLKATKMVKNQKSNYYFKFFILKKSKLQYSLNDMEMFNAMKTRVWWKFHKAWHSLSYKESFLKGLEICATLTSSPSHIHPLSFLHTLFLNLSIPSLFNPYSL